MQPSFASDPGLASSPALLALQGLVLGWTVAAIPGPINLEMARRGLKHGFRAAFVVGLGASSGDFLWALAVTAGVGSVGAGPAASRWLGAVSAAVLLILGARLLLASFRAVRRLRAIGTGGGAGSTEEPPAAPALPSGGAGFAFGFVMAVTSPFNVVFWLGVLGTSATGRPGIAAALLLAVSVVVGALTWCLTLCTAVRAGTRFTGPRWEAATEGLAGAVMIWAGLRSALLAAESVW